MRTRSSWLAVMLTAGIALAPALTRGQDGGPLAGDNEARSFELAPLPVWSGPALPSVWNHATRPLPGNEPAPETTVPADHYEPPLRIVRGQDVPYADPAYPVPLWHRHAERGGFFTAAEFVFIRQSRHVDPQVVAVRGFTDADGSIFGQPGTFVGTGTIALRADDLGPLSYQPGWRITAGWRFEDESVVTFDWMHLTSAKYTGQASLVAPLFRVPVGLADTFLFSGVYNFPIAFAGPDVEVPLGLPGAVYGIWNGAEEMSILFTQRYDEYNITYRVPIFRTECSRTYGLVGGRLAWIWERFKWRTVDYDINGEALPLDTAIYTNIVSNRMYGPFIGCGNEWWCGNGFAISLDLQAALLLDVVKERAKYERGDYNTQAKRARTVYNIVPELVGQLNLWWYPIEGVQVRLGYNAMAFFNTVAAEEPIAFNFGAMDPPWSNRFLRVLDGFNVGVGLIW